MHWLGIALISQTTEYYSVDKNAENEKVHSHDDSPTCVDCAVRRVRKKLYLIHEIWNKTADRHSIHSTFALDPTIALLSPSFLHSPRGFSLFLFRFSFLSFGVSALRFCLLAFSSKPPPVFKPITCSVSRFLLFIVHGVPFFRLRQRDTDNRQINLITKVSYFTHIPCSTSMK